MACYPLVPYSNRIADAFLLEGGRRHRLRANAPPEAHALHGFGWQRPWQVASREADALTLTLLHGADEDWPFACEAVQTFRLMEDQLQLGLSLRNTGVYAMPAGLGFHPYFPLSPGTTLQAEWKSMWTMDVDSLPSELTPISAELDFSRERPVSGWKVDNCFTGWNGYAALDYATHCVRIEAGEACRTIVCFAPADGRDFIALEPVTHVNNAFALEAEGVANTGVRTLRPGESFDISILIRIEAH